MTSNYSKTAYLIGPAGGAYYEKTIEALLLWRECQIYQSFSRGNLIWSATTFLLKIKLKLLKRD